MRTRPLAIAHRGNSGVAPANTLVAIRQAIDLGVDMIEIDVNLAKDRVPVLIHNNSVDETTNGAGLVSSFTLKELKTLDAGSWKDSQFADERIPTLAETLECARGKVHLSLDIKDESVIPNMIKTVQEADMKDDVVICGCYVSTAEKVRCYDDRLTIVLNVDSELGKLAKREDKSEFIREYIHQACYAHLSALNVSYKYVTEELIRRAHLKALPVWTWTVDNPEDMRRLIDMGVDAIYTNWPGRLLNVLSNYRTADLAEN